jgi:hypothetical protein
VSVGEHPAPLAPEWLGAGEATHRAGTSATVAVKVRNAGRATWRSDGAEGLQLSYHWLDSRGNPIVWDGPRTPFREPVRPGQAAELLATVVAPRPPGRYVLRFDLVEEHCFWLAELGCPTLDVDVDVVPLITRRRLAVRVHGGPDEGTTRALAAQEEELVDDDADAVAHLVAGSEPAPDWSRRLLDAHADGWPAVGPALVTEAPGLLSGRRRAARSLQAWGPGGRNPRFDGPVLLPSLLVGMEPGVHLGLPAYEGEGTVFEGRAVVRLPRRSGRRPT